MLKNRKRKAPQKKGLYFSTDEEIREKQIRAKFRKSHPSVFNPDSDEEIIELKPSLKRRKTSKSTKSTKKRKKKERYTKYTGVQRNKKSGKWFSQKVINGKNKTLGTFDTAEEAA